jgi:hypothetical protein
LSTTHAHSQAHAQHQIILIFCARICIGRLCTLCMRVSCPATGQSLVYWCVRYTLCMCVWVPDVGARRWTIISIEIFRNSENRHRRSLDAPQGIVFTRNIATRHAGLSHGCEKTGSGGGWTTGRGAGGVAEICMGDRRSRPLAVLTPRSATPGVFMKWTRGVSGCRTSPPGGRDCNFAVTPTDPPKLGSDPRGGGG